MVCLCVCNLQQMTFGGMRGSDGGKCSLGRSHSLGLHRQFNAMQLCFKLKCNLNVFPQRVLDP